MRFLRRSLVGLFLLALTIGILAYAGHTMYSAVQERMARESKPRPARERVFAANVVMAEMRDIAPVLTTFGEVRSRRTLDIRATASGTIVELADGFVEGGTVTEGQLLLRIDPRDARAALDVARTDMDKVKADLAEAEIALGLARDELEATSDQARLRTQALDRQVSLRDRGVGTVAAVEAAELASAAAQQAVVARRQAVAQAEARLAQARNAVARQTITVAEARRALAETEIRASFSGILSDVAVVEGGLISNNERLAQLIDPKQLEVSFRISTGQYARLLDARGTLQSVPVEVVLDVSGIDLSTKGAVSRVSGAVAEGQTGRLLFAGLDDGAGFRPGDFVTVRVTEPVLERVALLPSSALDAANTVLALGDGDRLDVVKVDLLRRQGDDVLVRGRGLFDREVVAERVPQLGAGIKIRPLRHGAAEEPLEKEMVALTDERREKLIAFVEGNKRMPSDVRKRIVSQLQKPEVSAEMINRLEQRMGG
ncbi:MAG: efflux RND transporter periplasmic adaptor subunit [Brevirhabdus sp.]